MVTMVGMVGFIVYIWGVSIPVPDQLLFRPIMHETLLHYFSVQ